MRLHPPAVSVFAAAWLAALLLPGLPGGLRAQAPFGPDTTESTTQDATGIITGVALYHAITVRDRRGPFTYRLGQDLHVYGPDNRPLRITEVRPGDEATVYYYFRDGLPTIGRIVILRRGQPAGK